MEKTLTINGKKVSFDKEKNLLEVIRKANIELPTFCYHSELSTYGACRLCLVNVEKRGLVPACSTQLAHQFTIQLSLKTDFCDVFAGEVPVDIDVGDQGTALMVGGGGGGAFALHSFGASGQCGGCNGD